MRSKLAKLFKLKYQYIADYTVEFELDEEFGESPVEYVTGEGWEWDEIVYLNSELLEDSIQVVED